jgi:protein CrcB
MIKMMLIAGAGGFVGTCCRYLVTRWCAMMFSGTWPLGTFLVNIVGCFVFGVLLGLFEKTQTVSTTESLLLVTGFCGGFTTFSAFAGEVCLLGDKGQFVTSLVYLLASVTLGVIMVIAGRALIR